MAIGKLGSYHANAAVASASAESCNSTGAETDVTQYDKTDTLTNSNRPAAESDKTDLPTSRLSDNMAQNDSSGIFVNVKQLEALASIPARDGIALKFQGIQMTETTATLSPTERDDLLSKLCQEIDKRFGDFEQSPVLSSMILLDIKLWPKSQAALNMFGNN